MVRAEEDSEIVCVEDLGQVLLHLLNLKNVIGCHTYVHSRVKRQALDEEHGVLEFIDGQRRISRDPRVIRRLPDDADRLRVQRRDEAARGSDLEVNR